MMMKIEKRILLVLGALLTVLLVACGNAASSTDSNTDEGHVDDWMSEYGIREEHRFYEISMYEALQLRDEEDFDGILLFTFPECPWCRQAIPIVHKASQIEGVDIFYVSRSHSLREGEWLDWDAEMAWWLYEQGVANMAWLYEALDDDADEDEVPERIRPNINVPQIVHLRSGQVLGNHRSTLEGHDPVENEDGGRELPDLTDEQRAMLLEIYVGIFSAVNEVEACGLEQVEDASDCE